MATDDRKLGKNERLKSRIEIGRLFGRGSETVASYPVRIIFRRARAAGAGGFTGYRAAFVVPKKKFKRAPDRNLLKRRLREAYRQHKHLLPPLEKVPGEPETGIALLVLYTGKEALPYHTIERKLVKLLPRLRPGTDKS